MALFDDESGHNDTLVRKALGAVVAVAPMSETALTSILDDTTGDLAPLPAPWIKLGRPTEDGESFARETEVSEIFGHGSIDPARSDVRRAVKRASITFLESRKKLMELAQGVETLGETVTRTTGGTVETTWDETESPTYPYMRLIVIAKDITDAGEFYIARHALRCKVTEVGEEVWSDQDQAMTTPLTFTFYTDPTEGTPLRHFRGGPGYEAIAEDEGFTVPA